MLTPVQVQAAIKYNTWAAQNLWHQKELPYPFTSANVEMEAFVLVTYTFQTSHGLYPDGQLGPATLGYIKQMGGTAVRRNVSNNLILGGKKVPVPAALLTAGVTVTNWVEDGETHFDAQARSKPVTHLVIHESVSRDGPSTVKTLKSKGYGVHLMVNPDGSVVCHNDLLTEAPIHGNQLNGCSVGLEVVNPYSAAYMKPPFTATIPAKWWTWVPSGAARLYVLPTNNQMNTLKALVPWLCDLLPDLPYAFPTKNFNAQNRKVPGWDTAKAKPAPGVVAHTDYAEHADGRYLIEELSLYENLPYPR